MKSAILFLSLSILSFALVGCGESDKKREVSKDHVWKAQEEALKKAKKAEDLVTDADQQTRKQIEDSFR